MGSGLLQDPLSKPGPPDFSFYGIMFSSGLLLNRIGCTARIVPKNFEFHFHDFFCNWHARQIALVGQPSHAGNLAVRQENVYVQRSLLEVPLLGREVALRRAAHRAHPVCGEILETRSRRYAVIRISQDRIINVTTHLAHVTHRFLPCHRFGFSFSLPVKPSMAALPNFHVQLVRAPLLKINSHGNHSEQSLVL